MKLTFDLNHGCQCAQFPLVTFEVDFQSLIRTNKVTIDRLFYVLSAIELRRVTLQHSGAKCGSFEYTSSEDLLTCYGMYKPHAEKTETKL
jgi:hypothetical protein